MVKMSDILYRKGSCSEQMCRGLEELGSSVWKVVKEGIDKKPDKLHHALRNPIIQLGLELQPIAH